MAAPRDEVTGGRSTRLRHGQVQRRQRELDVSGLPWFELGTGRMLVASEALEADHEEVVLEGLLDWVSANFADLNERKRVVARLAPHLRLRFLRKEFLKSALFRLPELDLIRAKIQKSLATKLARGDGQIVPARQSKRFQIVESVRLSSDGSMAKLKSANWLGKKLTL